MFICWYNIYYYNILSYKYLETNVSLFGGSMGTFIPRNNVKKYMKIFLKHKSLLSLLVTNKYTTQ